jgi:hypothetical protein
MPLLGGHFLPAAEQARGVGCKLLRGWVDIDSDARDAGVIHREPVIRTRMAPAGAPVRGMSGVV